VCSNKIAFRFVASGGTEDVVKGDSTGIEFIVSKKNLVLIFRGLAGKWKVCPLLARLLKEV